jgi:long-chain acyl-CoA synthetase
MSVATVTDPGTPAPPDGLPDRLTDGLFGHGDEHAGDPLLSVLEDGRWRNLSVGEVAARVRAIAAGLVAAGIDPGDRVAILSATRLEWTLCDYAVITAGAVTVPIYETSSAEQIEWILADSGARAVFCETTAHRAVIDALHPGLADLAHVWCFDDGEPAGLEAGAAAPPSPGPSAAELAATVEQRRLAALPDDLASIVYTSGTTGRPKGCELTHGNCLAELHAVVPCLTELFNPDASTLLFLPLAHIFGRAIQLGAIQTRTRLGYCPDAKDLVRYLQSFQPTFILAVPRVFEKIYNTATTQARVAGEGRLGALSARIGASIFDDAERAAVAWSQADAAGRVGIAATARRAVFDRLVYARLRHVLGGRITHAVSGGGPLGARLGHFFHGAGITVLEGYGLTETLAAATLNRPGGLKIGTVGQAVPGVSLRIADDGEVLIRGANVFRGYWHNPDAATATFEGGWFRSGDIGEIDADGFLSITGRKKELIVTAAGKNVAPAVLEDRLRAHRLVSQCMVVGDNRPFIACLVTVDEEAWPGFAAEHGLAGPLADHLDSEVLRAEIQTAVDDANRAVSKAESIRKFVILPDDFTEDNGEITPTLKLKRSVVALHRADAIAALYR